uniref:MatE protein n=1 Tax=Candidatus Kentrum sp. LPFa TaxID=2126335 RepID=A0A450WM34_9GAMM|nr:MAG: MatE protein [Candidatus Kentron sp. LPFa]
MTGKASQSNLPTLSDLRAILQTALPLGIGYIGTMLIGVTDTMMLGHSSPDALSAAGLALSISNIILVIGWGMVFPILVFVSRRCGRECPRSRIPSKIIRQNLWVCGILFVPSCVVLWNTTPILLLTGQDPLLARMAGEYMDYYLWSIFPETFARWHFQQFIVIRKNFPEKRTEKSGL